MTGSVRLHDGCTCHAVGTVAARRIGDRSRRRLHRLFLVAIRLVFIIVRCKLRALTPSACTGCASSTIADVTQPNEDILSAHHQRRSQKHANEQRARPQARRRRGRAHSGATHNRARAAGGRRARVWTDTASVLCLYQPSAKNRPHLALEGGSEGQNCRLCHRHPADRRVYIEKFARSAIVARPHASNHLPRTNTILPLARSDRSLDRLLTEEPRAPHSKVCTGHLTAGTAAHVSSRQPSSHDACHTPGVLA